MHLIIGGAYQGKREFAKERWNLKEKEIFTCTGTEIDFTKKCIDHLEEFTFACVQAGVDPRVYMEEHKEEWRDSIVICQDLFCGVVPMEVELRAWRRVTGHLCRYLTTEAQGVSRIFCGLEQKLK